MQQSWTQAGFRGVYAVGGGVAWASGTNGTVLRTEDAGYMWQACAVPPGAEKLDFRGIQAWDENTAIVMSSGPGDQSRLYKTTDGCSHWTLLFTNPDKDGFWDAVKFVDRKQGYLLGDPVHGRFVMLKTEDGGRTWKQDMAAGLEVSGTEHVGAFAASNSSLLAGSRQAVTFGTGGAWLYTQTRQGAVDFSAPPGTPIPMHEQWTRARLPLTEDTESAGIFSLGWREITERLGWATMVAVGGDYSKPEKTEGTAAFEGPDGWTVAAKPPHGFRSAVVWDADAKAWIAAGTSGSDISYDDGKTWQPLDDGNWNAISLPWIVGPKGRIARLDERMLKR